MWNYRVIESADRTEVFIAEVLYGDEFGDELHGCWGPVRRVYCRHDESDSEVDGVPDLKATIQAMLKAFDKPVLRVGDGDKLIGLAPAEAEAY